MAGIVKKEKKNHKLPVKTENKDEGEEREKEKESRVHTCWEADSEHDFALNTIHTNWGQNQPMQFMFRIHPVRKLHQVQKS